MVANYCCQFTINRYKRFVTKPVKLFHKSKHFCTELDFTSIYSRIR